MKIEITLEVEDLNTKELSEVMQQINNELHNGFHECNIYKTNNFFVRNKLKYSIKAIGKNG